jgi:hypothetical protein
MHPMDIVSRNLTTGWVFGTFQYEKSASSSPNWWEHLVPVGLMWGSDIAGLEADQPTQQEWINEAHPMPRDELSWFPPEADCAAVAPPAWPD